jgi:hypothetical protein
MNPDFGNNSKQQYNNSYKYNQQSSGYGGQQMQQNQFNPQAQGGNPNYANNAYGGYGLPEQYQNVYYNPYSYQAAQGQNAYPYNYNYQAQAQQPQQNQINNFDQNANVNANAQYQQMLLNTLSTTNPNQQQFVQGGNPNVQQSTGQNPNVAQTQNNQNQAQPQPNNSQNPTDLNNQYQAQMGGYMVPGYGYDVNQMNMVQMNQQQGEQQLPNQNVSEGEEKKPTEEQTDTIN